jgi:hypothetical protein
MGNLFTACGTRKNEYETHGFPDDLDNTVHCTSVINISENYTLQENNNVEKNDIVNDNEVLRNALILKFLEDNLDYPNMYILVDSILEVFSHYSLDSLYSIAMTLWLDVECSMEYYAYVVSANDYEKFKLLYTKYHMLVNNRKIGLTSIRGSFSSMANDGVEFSLDDDHFLVF